MKVEKDFCYISKTHFYPLHSFNEQCSMNAQFTHVSEPFVARQR